MNIFDIFVFIHRGNGAAAAQNLIISLIKLNYVTHSDKFLFSSPMSENFNLPAKNNNNGAMSDTKTEP